MKYRPADGRWQVLPRAKLLLELKQKWGTENYDAQKLALKEYLCNYFSAQDNCDAKQGNSISPLKATSAGGKVLKVRWAVPGCGKSGGLRLVVVAYCEQLRVVIAEAVFRKEGLSNQQVDDSLETLP